MAAESVVPKNGLRIGVFGSGMMGEKHLEAWHALGTPVHGVYARNGEQGRTLAARHGCTVYESLSSLLADIDIADICLPTFLHRSAVERAAQNGCQIVCEKPLALNYEDGDSMFKTCDAANVRLFVAMVVRFFPLYRRVWNRVHGGSLGKVQEIVLKRTVPSQPLEKTWFADDSLSGGVILDLLIHDIDYAIWLAGDVVKVHAWRERNARDQSAGLVLEHVGGATSKIEGGWFEAATTLETVLSVTGEHGKIDADSPQASTSLASDDPYVGQLRHFLTSLEDNKPFEVTRQEVLQVMRVALAAQEAARREHPVCIKPDTNL
jgi:predicted dehydrogenase